MLREHLRWDPHPGTERGENPQRMRAPAVGVKAKQVRARPRGRERLEQGGCWRPRKERRRGAAKRRRH